MSNHHRANAFEPALSSGVWEGLSYRQGCEGSDETRWTQTCLVFTDIRKGGVGRLTPRGEAPAWGREEPGSAIFRLCGKGISHWRGRQIHFALRGFVEPGSGGEPHLMRITLIKRHLGAFSNVVQYGGTLSPSGSSIQGTFTDGHFRLRQVDSVSHVLARELTGAWDGESSCRRGGQSNTSWKDVRLAFQPLPPGDRRGWGMLVTGGGDSLWKEQRIPFCITGRLSLPGLEVELEKQHVEGFHNRIAYFGRVLSGGGSGDKIMDGPSADDPVPPTRLVGVYEHGDFVLHRNPGADLDPNGRPLLFSSSTTSGGVGVGGGDTGSKKSAGGAGDESTKGGDAGGAGAGGGGGGGEQTVLEACINLFRRSADTSSVWSKTTGLHRPALVPPMARSHSGDAGGLPGGGPGTPPMMLGHGRRPPPLSHLHHHNLQQGARSSPPPPPQQHQRQQLHQRAMMVPMDGGVAGGRGVGSSIGPNKIVPGKHPSGPGNPPLPYALVESNPEVGVGAAALVPYWREEEENSGDGVGRAGGGSGVRAHWQGSGGGSENGHNDTSNIDMHYHLQHHGHVDAVPTPSSSPMLEVAGGARRAGGEEPAGALAWEVREPRQGWDQQQQQSNGTNGVSNGVRTGDGPNMRAALTASAWSNLGLVGGPSDFNAGGEGGGDGNGGTEFHGGDGGGASEWMGVFDDIPRQSAETEGTTGRNWAAVATAANFASDDAGVGDGVARGGGKGTTGGNAGAANGALSAALGGATNGTSGYRGALDFHGDHLHQDQLNSGSDAIRGTGSSSSSNNNNNNSGGIGAGGLGDMRVLRMSLAGPGAGEIDGHGWGATSSAAVSHVRERGDNANGGNPAITSNGGGSGDGSGVIGSPRHNRHVRVMSEPGQVGPSQSPSSSSAKSVGFRQEDGLTGNGGGGGGGPTQFNLTAAAAVAAAAIAGTRGSSSHAAFADHGSSGVSVGMAPLATVSTATAASGGDGGDKSKVARQTGTDEGGTVGRYGGGGGGGGGQEGCKMCFMGPADAVLLPCGHLCACQSCASVLHVCPICQADIYRVQPVYRS